MRAVCALSVAVVCAIGVAQVLHAHPKDSTPSHHACSICLAAHAGISVETGAATPVMVASALAAPAPEFARISAPAATQFIRPPPGF